MTDVQPLMYQVETALQKRGGLFSWARPDIHSGIPVPHDLATQGHIRQVRYQTGRQLAMRALAQLGGGVSEIKRSPSGAAEWPDGYRGSISHGDDFSIAVVFPRARGASVGIDVEGVNRISAEMWPSVFTQAEIFWLRQRDAHLRSTMATVLFSAKEAIQKAIYSHQQAWNELSQFTVSIDPEGNRFQCTQGPAGEGYYWHDGHYVICCYLL